MVEGGLPTVVYHHPPTKVGVGLAVLGVSLLLAATALLVLVPR